MWLQSAYKDCKIKEKQDDLENSARSERLLTVYSDAFTKDTSLGWRRPHLIAEGEESDVAEYKPRTGKKPKLPRTSYRHMVGSLQKGVKSGGKSQMVKRYGFKFL